MSKKDLIIQFGRSGHKQADLLQAIASGEKEFEGVKVSDIQGLCDSFASIFAVSIGRNFPIRSDVLFNSVESFLERRSDEMKALHDFGQIASGVSPRLDNLACVDCMFRDKSTIIIDGVEKQVGVTKAFCEIFVKPNSKPHDVLFEGVDCEFKEAEV